MIDKHFCRKLNNFNFSLPYHWRLDWQKISSNFAENWTIWCCLFEGNFSLPYHWRLDWQKISCLTKVMEYKARKQVGMLVFEGSDLRMLGANQKSWGICDRSKHQSYLIPLFCLFCQLVLNFQKKSKDSNGPRQKWTSRLFVKKQLLLR